MAETDAQYTSTNSFLQTHARDALREASNTERKIWGKPIPSLSGPRVELNLNKPNLEAPPKFSELFPDADGTAEEVKRLNDMTDEWVKDYFPSINECFKNVPDDWLCDVISGVKPFGMDKTVLEMIWHQARDQEQRTFQSNEAQLRSAFSERGFSLPPGAYVRAVDRVQQRASDAVSEVNRQEAIRQEEIKVQLIQFAVQQATQYKLGIMSSLADFYRMWVTVPDKDIERARVRSQAYGALYSALSTYYNVEIAFEELRLRAETSDADTQLSNDQNKIALYSADNSAAALGNAVRGFSQISGDSVNAAGSLIAQIESI